MRILFICRLATKPLEIKNQFQKEQKSQKPKEAIQKLKKFHKNGKNMCKRVNDFSPPHLNLTMFSLGAKEPQPIRKTPKNTKYTKVMNKAHMHKS